MTRNRLILMHVLLGMLQGLGLGCGKKRVCTPPCAENEKCRPKWTECSGPFGLTCTESQESRCVPKGWIGDGVRE